MRLLEPAIHGEFDSPVGESAKTARRIAERQVNRFGTANRAGAGSGGLTMEGSIVRVGTWGTSTFEDAIFGHGNIRARGR